MSEREWIAAIVDAEQREKVRRLLVALMMLSDAPSRNYEPSVGKSKSDGNPPARETSLYTYYRDKMKRDVGRKAWVDLEATCIEAQARIDEYQGGAEQTDRIKRQRERDEKSDIAQLVQHGQGIPSAIISARNNWHIGWVKHIRRQNGQDPDYGHPIPRWRELSEEERYSWVQECKDEGLSVRQAALRLGVSSGSVGNYWTMEEAA
jgi:hypothetical protein